MLALSKKTDYALIALSYLAGGDAPRVASAREIAEAFGLPMALLMNVMKELQQAGLVKSLRGTKGGYLLSADLEVATLYDVVVATDGEVATTECSGTCEAQATELATCRVAERCPVRGQLQALHRRFVRFLKDVRLAEVVLPGRRVDVPSDCVSVAGRDMVLAAR